MGLGLEEERTAQVGSGRNDDDTTSLTGGLVDDGLNLGGLYQGTVVHYTVVGDGVLGAQRFGVYNFGLAEPVGNRCTVGELLLPCNGEAEKSSQC